MKKQTKATKIIKMLNAGESVTFIKRMLGVSESYIYLVKKMLAHGVEAAVEKTTTLGADTRYYPHATQRDEAIIEAAAAIKEACTFTPKEVGVSDEAFIEVALAASQGKGKERVVGTMERKVPGGPATVVRATTEDRVERILDDRGTNYGTFLSLSQVTQRLKAVAHNFAGQNNKTFDADQAEALDMIFTKVGRILNGDSNHIDSWIDIAGYATLVADRLQGKAR